MSKSELAILASKTPDAYVDNSIKSKLTPARKAALAKLWMEKTGYTRADILYARNRHPYWKRKKMENSGERAHRRLERHDYSGGKPVEWNEVLVGKFLDLSQTDREGAYTYRDCELAKRFKTTIPSIQYMRRKLRLVESLLGARAARGKVVEYLGRSESLLKQGKGAVERFSKREQDLHDKPGKSTATRSSGASKKGARKVPARKKA